MSTHTRTQFTILHLLLYETGKDLKYHTLDVKNATKCDVNHNLKYFLYLILEKDSSEKKRLDQIQDEIESLQKDRYYQTKNEDAKKSRVDDTDAQATETYEQQETRNDDCISEVEQKFVQHREKILDEILDDILENILPIANIEEARELLQRFEVETACYESYVSLCNYLLKALKSVSTGFHVRDPSYLDIQFHCNNPQSNGMTDKLQDKPCVVITSLFAALQAGRLVKVDGAVFSERPKRNFEWEATLASNEFQVQNKKKIPINGNFVEVLTSTTSRASRVEHNDMKLWTSSVADTDLSEASKRLRDDDQDTSKFQHIRKKRRDSNSILVTSTLSGSNENSTVSSTSTKYSQAESQTMATVNGLVKCASYATEVLSYSAGVHHVINLLFTDEYLLILYYDRQGIIQSNGINIFSDFPRFLVLLFALQRFNLEDWGIISSLNPKALLAHGLAQEEPKGKRCDSSNQQGTDKGYSGRDQTDISSLPVVSSSPVVFPLTQDLEHLWLNENHPLIEVQVDMDNFLSTPPSCLADRATAVVSATGLTKTLEKTPMVCKIYHPELQQRHEGLILEVIHRIAKEHNPAMTRHLPTMYFHVDVPNTTTHRIRSIVKRSWKGHRVLRIIGLKKLDKITTLDGGQFIKAWLEVVTCHSFLWQHFVEHGDPSVNNMMYDPDEKCGVLTDFDLSLLQWEPHIFGTDRTGTIPFMALDLLSEAYWEGRTRRCYHHELESFIWILPYVFLLYETGIRKTNPLVDVWSTSNYETCRQNKGSFLNRSLDRAESSVQLCFKDYWQFADELCYTLSQAHNMQRSRRRANRSSLKALSISKDSSSSRAPAPSEDSLSSLDSKELRDSVIGKLWELCEDDDELRVLVASLEAHKPSFQEPGIEISGQLRKKFRPIFQREFGTGINAKD